VPLYDSAYRKTCLCINLPALAGGFACPSSHLPIRSNPSKTIALQKLYSFLIHSRYNHRNRFFIGQCQSSLQERFCISRLKHNPRPDPASLCKEVTHYLPLLISKHESASGKDIQQNLKYLMPISTKNSFIPLDQFVKFPDRKEFNL